MKKDCNNTAYDYDLDSPEWQWRDEAERQEAQRLFALEAQWQRKMAALRTTPCSETVDETTIEQDAAEMHKAFRHDMSPEDWTAFQTLIHRQKIAKWQTFVGSIMGDYDYSEIFVLLQFKIDRMVDYWRQFSHLANGDRIRSQMEPSPKNYTPCAVPSSWRTTAAQDEKNRILMTFYRWEIHYKSPYYSQKFFLNISTIILRRAMPCFAYTLWVIRLSCVKTLFLNSVL